MKTAFTFKKWYWDEDDRPQWWINFIKGKGRTEIYNELSSIAKITLKINGSTRVVFNSPGDLSFFILRWS